MIEVYDKNLKKLGVLERAFNVYSEESLNLVDFLHFSLNFKDMKRKLCQPFNFVKAFGKFFRIMPTTLNKSQATIIEYTCEHSIARLMDSILFGSHTIGNRGVYTEEVLNYILSHQTKNIWKLGKCEFRRQFEYHFEQENLLSALLSVPKPFNEDYVFEFGTENDPFTINLLKRDTSVKHYYMAGKNIITTNVEEEPTEICTRLYPLGAGEGVNQIGIQKVNNSKPYIESPQHIIDKYGIIERVWTDRSFENEETLLSSAKKLLKEMETPKITRQIEASTLRTDGEIKLGQTVRLIDKGLDMDVNTVIKAITRGSDNKIISLEISNKKSDIANSLADLADRQRIESSYSQGATQIYAQSVQTNADSKDGAELNFYIPKEMKFINKVLVKIKTEAFRAFSKATEGGGAVSSTTKSGGGSWESTDSGGGSLETTTQTTSIVTQKDGGGFEVDTAWGGTDVEYIVNQTQPAGVDNHTHGVRQVHGHRHIFEMPDHKHEVDSKPHSHSIRIPSHKHDVRIPSHKHDFKIPNHTHKITPGIYRFGRSGKFKIMINDKEQAVYDGSTQEIDITEMLVNDEGMINRGSWHSVKAVPEDLSYISISLYLQGFVQSRGEMTV